MGAVSSRKLIAGAVLIITSASSLQVVHAEDFLSALFGGFTRRHETPSIQPLPFADDSRFGDQNSGDVNIDVRPRASAGVGRQAYCVRTCDGRYFPISASDGQSRAASCNNFCPSSETKIVYGSSIEQAATENGKPYSELPNAFRYRTELVSGCTCNGKDQTGLSPVKIENDPTLRRGDIVAGADGLMVARSGADKRGAALNMSPASASIRAKYQRLPVVASD